MRHGATKVIMGEHLIAHEMIVDAEAAMSRRIVRDQRRAVRHSTHWRRHCGTSTADLNGS